MNASLLPLIIIISAAGPGSLSDGVREIMEHDLDLFEELRDRRLIDRSSSGSLVRLASK